MGERTADYAEAVRLRDAARRLAAAMDRAGFYKAAAYAAMAADAVLELRTSGNRRAGEA